MSRATAGSKTTTELAAAIAGLVRQEVAAAGTRTPYREPLVGFAAARDPRFADLPRLVDPAHLLPEDLLPGARSVVSFFVPFAPSVVEANARDREQVPVEWAAAYVETNALIGRIAARLIAALAEQGIRAAAEPATSNFDPDTLRCRWSHKSVAVIAGLGSFGLHQMAITDAGCAGRFGSVVVEADLPAWTGQPRTRCRYFHDGSCLECVARCPAAALDAGGAPLDKQRCWNRLLAVAGQYEDWGAVEVCGKCAVGPCALGSAV